jgi:DNA polymerase elongation subunit (family B)
MTSSPDGDRCPRPHGVPHYGLDIETDTSVDGLDPSCSRVVAAAVASDVGDRVFLGPEVDILRQLDGLLASLPPGVLVTWNGSGFDLPFLARRAAVQHVPIGLRLHHPTGHRVGAASWGHHGHLDGYRLYRADVGRTLGLSCGLKAMARLTGAEPVEVDRTRIHALTTDELTQYVASDARLAVELVARRMPAAAGSVDRCPTGDRAPRPPGPDVTPA